LAKTKSVAKSSKSEEDGMMCAADSIQPLSCCRAFCSTAR